MGEGRSGKEILEEMLKLRKSYPAEVLKSREVLAREAPEYLELFHKTYTYVVLNYTNEAFAAISQAHSNSAPPRTKSWMRCLLLPLRQASMRCRWPCRSLTKSTSNGQRSSRNSIEFHRRCFPISE